MHTCLPEQGLWQSEEHCSVHPGNFGNLQDMIFMRPKGQQFWSPEESKQCTQEISCSEDLCPVTAPFKRHCWHVLPWLSALAALG